MTGLASLEDKVRKELEIIRSPDRSWVRPRSAADGGKIIDVLIIGAGQCGLGVGFGLLRESIDNILILDKQPAGKQGPWRSFARMKTLRSPKHFNGPDLDVPSLAFQSWFEARYGEVAWRALHKAPKELWHDYLQWFAAMTGLPLAYETCVESIVPDGDVLSVRVRVEGGSTRWISARKVVLATGAEGNGAWSVPAVIRDGLPRENYFLMTEDIPFARFSGKSVGVIGGGASAYDNASAALESGAHSASVLIRRPGLHRINPHKWTEFSGFLNHFRDLDDAMKWSIMSYILPMREPVPPESFARASAHPGLHLCFGATLQAAGVQDGRIRIVAGGRAYEFDAVILCTGVETNLALRGELREIVDDIALWKDRHPCGSDAVAEGLGRFPYLGANFEFIEKIPGAAPHLKHIHNLTSGATLSHGPSGASINGLKAAIRRLVDGIRRDFFLSDAGYYEQELRQFSIPELTAG